MSPFPLLSIFFSTSLFSSGSSSSFSPSIKKTTQEEGRRGDRSMDGLSMESCCEEQGQGGILLSLESHKAVPAPFLTKTYQLVDDPSTDHVVSWGDNHATFVVWRPPEFARDLLPNYFKHNNFSSFVRQLNTYGFRKIVPERWEFANEFFRKGEKHLLCEIHRRKTSSCASSSSQTPSPLPYQHYYHHRHSPSPPYFTGFFRPALSSPDSDELPLPSWCDTTSPVSSPGLVMGGNAVAAAAAAAASSSSSPAAAAAASALLDDNERLRRSNAMLLSELAHMRKLYNDIIYFVQNHVQPVAPSSSYPASSLLPAPNPCAQKLPAFYHHQQQQQQQKQTETGTGKGCLMMNSSSTTSSSSLTIADEASPTNNQKNSSSSGEEESQKRGSSSGSSRPKLFGVPLGSSDKKRLLHPDEQEPTSPSPATKPRFVLNDEDLGFHLMPPSTCIAH